MSFSSVFLSFSSKRCWEKHGTACKSASNDGVTARKRAISASSYDVLPKSVSGHVAPAGWRSLPVLE